MKTSIRKLSLSTLNIHKYWRPPGVTNQDPVVWETNSKLAAKSRHKININL